MRIKLQLSAEIAYFDPWPIVGNGIQKLNAWAMQIYIIYLFRKLFTISMSGWLRHSKNLVFLTVEKFFLYKYWAC